MGIEAKIHEAVSYQYEATGFVVGPKKFVIGVSPEGWKELGGDEDTKTVKFMSFGKTYLVSPLSGLPDGSVALIWS